MPDHIGVAEEALGARLTGLQERAERKFLDERIGERVDALDARYRSLRSISAPFDIVSVNRMFPNIRTNAAALFSKIPDVIITPEDETPPRNAQALEKALNVISWDQKFPRVIRRVLRHALKYPFGAVLITTDPRKHRWPRLEAIHPKDLRTDPGQPHFDPEAGTWFSVRFERSVTALRMDGRFDKKALERLVKKSAIEDEDMPVKLWQHWIWDMVENRPALMYAVMSDDTMASELLRVTKFSEVIGLPLRDLVFNESDDTYYPFATGELWIDQQRELNTLRTQQLIHAQRSNSILAYDLNKVTEDERKKLASQEPEIRIGVDGPPRESMSHIDPTQLSSDVYASDGRVSDDIGDIEGIPLTASPRTAAPSPSATEVSARELKFRARASDRQEAFEEWMERVYKAAGKLVQEHAQGTLKLALESGVTEEVSRREMQGRVKFRIKIGSTLATSRESQQTEAVVLYDRLRGDPFIRQQELRRFLFTELDRPEMEKLLTTPEETAAEKQAEAAPPAGAAGAPGPAGLAGQPGAAGGDLGALPPEAALAQAQQALTQGAPELLQSPGVSPLETAGSLRSLAALV